MNYLAHLALAENTAQSRIGNLLGDFMKGVEVNTLPHIIRHGLENHRRVDRITDSHPAVMALREIVSPERRRYSGIISDIAFDYFLSKHWDRFMTENRQALIQDCYHDLNDQRHTIPEPMQPAIDSMIQFDTLDSYQHLDGVAQAIDRVSQRLRFRNKLAGGIQEVINHYDAFEDSFLQLYPQLLDTVQSAPVALSS